MLTALGWLTVCLPVVNKAQKQYQQAAKQIDGSEADDNTNPLSNTNEEKGESGVSLLSEYLHEAPAMERHFVILSQSYSFHPSDLYLAYHPDLIIPPPKA